MWEKTCNEALKEDGCALIAKISGYIAYIGRGRQGGNE
jgi:hypothetical protein